MRLVDDNLNLQINLNVNFNPNIIGHATATSSVLSTMLSEASLINDVFLGITGKCKVTFLFPLFSNHRRTLIKVNKTQIAVYI